MGIWLYSLFPPNPVVVRYFYVSQNQVDWQMVFQVSNLNNGDVYFSVHPDAQTLIRWPCVGTQNLHKDGKLVTEESKCRAEPRKENIR